MYIDNNFNDTQNIISSKILQRIKRQKITEVIRYEKDFEEK